MKELKYQNDAQAFLEKTFQQYNGKAGKIYSEEFSTEYDSVLQECSPLIGGKVGDPIYNRLKSGFGVVGLREKINQLNEKAVIEFLTKHQRTDSVNDVLECMFQDFIERHKNAQNEAELFQLIFADNQLLKSQLKRHVYLKDLKVPCGYNVVYHEKAGDYQGKNDFYIIREKRIPIYGHAYKKSERPDFLYYVNGIPLVMVEYKTEDSGILKSLKDFEMKESYQKIPFKIALNDGRDVLFFSDIKLLKFKDGKDNSFHWVHYLPAKKYTGKNKREFTNIEYLFDELFCQSENMYSYCIDGCSVMQSDSHYYLVNARIQQYYAIKDIKKTLVQAKTGLLPLPYNFEVAHAQRSGKTITMKLITYLIERNFKSIFNVCFFYTPDLQIKKVIHDELFKSGNSKISVKMVETRAEYQDIIDDLYLQEKTGKSSNGFAVYIVNMQKITDKDIQDIMTAKIISSSKILNLIDEAHHGQAKETALIRQAIFPNSSNYLFTATGKPDMYLFYFPDNNRKGFCSKFTLSNAKKCKITVPVIFSKAKNLITISDKLAIFSSEVEKRLLGDYTKDSSLVGGVDEGQAENYLNIANKKISSEIKKTIQKESLLEKIDAIVGFMDRVRIGLTFAPKAIVYVNSVEDAKQYIQKIQTFNLNNEYKGYRFGVDFSAISEICEQYNPGISDPDDISANFQKDRVTGTENNTIIDILIAVDKYQKGFDLPALLVTFLDTNISEPARMNQIFTRSATKHNGKITGYCVDLSLEDINSETFKQSIFLYDNIEEVGDSFIDDDILEKLKKVLTVEFANLMKELDLTPQTFTPDGILEKVLNEVNLEIRRKRQHSFFNISKNIVSNLAKMGSPLFFKPFSLELKALSSAFNKFKEIYAHPEHPEHSKILINTDNSFKDGQYITTEEIRVVIADVLTFLNEKHIKDIISFNYDNQQNEIDVDPSFKNEWSERFSQELKKNNVEQDIDELGDYVFKYHRDLYDLIKDMLDKISGDRSLIYQDSTQEKLSEIEEKLTAVKHTIQNQIKTLYNGNRFLFWSNHVASETLEDRGVYNPDFVSFLSQEVFEHVNTFLGDIDPNLSVYDKVEEAASVFFSRKDLNLSSYLSDYYNLHKEDKKKFSEAFVKQLQDSPKIDGNPMIQNNKLFKDYLKKTLESYYK